jgi:3-oxoacyl-[acyl-carrier protein] reductase
VRVFVSDLHERRLAEAVERLRAVDADRVEAKLCDVTREPDVRALVAAAIATLGQVDVLVNNAGLGGAAAVIEMTDEQWHKVLDVSLTSVFRMTRAMLPHMYAKRAGAIVNNASVLGWRAQALQAHYAAAKAGVMAFTRCAAIEAAEYGVRINAVAPSIAMHAFLNRVTSDELLTELKRREAFGRTAEVWEVANVIVFLASDLASYMTGEVVSVSSQHA